MKILTYTNQQILKGVLLYSQHSFNGIEPCGHCFLFYYALMKDAALVLFYNTVTMEEEEGTK